MRKPDYIFRDPPLPSLRNAAAPSGFVYCAICRGFQHPRRHDPAWVSEQHGVELETYARPPLGDV